MHINISKKVFKIAVIIIAVAGVIYGGYRVYAYQRNINNVLSNQVIIINKFITSSFPDQVKTFQAAIKADQQGTPAPLPDTANTPKK